ncbi:MAG: AI-2E family transporter [Candidatus Pacebacteria bacterium]|nr:AI-2E family transporter [Candidatus Paceibacterota bacterium]
MNKVTSSRFLIGSLIAMLIVLGILFAPFFSVFVIAVVFGVLFQPVNNLLRRICRPSIASFATVVLIVLIITGPILFVVSRIVGQAGDILAGLQSGSIVPHTMVVAIQEKMNELFPTANINVLDSFKHGLTWLTEQSGSFFQSIAVVILNLFISLIALFYWFKDSDKLKTEALKIIPLSREDSTGIIDRFSSSVYSLIRGTLLVAIIQGVSAGIGFTIFGVPNAILLASITVLCALVPTLGTTLIFVPVIGYLLISGNTFSAIGIAVWGITAVGLVDNLIGPRLMSRGSNMHPLFTLMAVLGGVQVFGAIGLFAGPLLVSLFFSICTTYIGTKPDLEVVK